MLSRKGWERKSVCYSASNRVISLLPFHGYGTFSSLPLPRRINILTLYCGAVLCFFNSLKAITSLLCPLEARTFCSEKFSLSRRGRKQKSMDSAANIQWRRKEHRGWVSARFNNQVLTQPLSKKSTGEKAPLPSRLSSSFQRKKDRGPEQETRTLVPQTVRKERSLLIPGTVRPRGHNKRKDYLLAASKRYCFRPGWD